MDTVVHTAETLVKDYRYVFFGELYAVTLTAIADVTWANGVCTRSRKERVGFKVWVEDDGYYGHSPLNCSFVWAPELISLLQEASDWVAANFDTESGSAEYFWREDDKNS